MIGTLALATFAALLAPGPAAPPEGVVYGEAPTGAAAGYVVLLDQQPGIQSAGQAQAAVAAAAADLAGRFGGEVQEQFSAAVHGFAIDGLDEADARRLAAAAGVARVERNILLHATATQADAPWSLGRIDDRSGTDTVYTYPNTASHVTAYSVDSGIRVAHTQFGGRASYGRNFVDRATNPNPIPANAGNSNDPANANDCDGHGTHVASTIGGTTYGVAKGINLVAVRVLDCGGDGYLSEVVAGVDWVTAHAARPAVVNMSLGGEKTEILAAAVRRSINSGLTWTVAAGNGDADDNPLNACDNSPGDVAEAIVVGASSSSDHPVRWSDYGPCVDLFAPGEGILSAWNTDNSATRRLDGTSMASPHVAGAAALILEAHPDYSPQLVRAALVQSSTVGALDMSTYPAYAAASTANRLLYVRQADPPRPGSRTVSLFNPRFGTTEVYARTTGGSLAYAYRSGEWSGWTDLGGTTQADPAVLHNPRFGTTEVYARLANGHVAYRYFYNGWADWIDLGGDGTGTPAVLYNPRFGTTEVYARLASGNLAYRYFLNGWSSWIDLGGPAAADPAVLYNPRFGTTEVYAKVGATLAYRYYLNGWAGWINLGGTVEGTPGVLYNPRYGTTEAYTRAADGTLKYRYYLSGWSSWVDLGGSVDSDPGVVYNRTSGTTEVYVHTPADELRYIYYLGGWSGWNTLGGAMAGSPSVLYNPSFGTTEAYTAGRDGHAYYTFYAGGWSGLLDLTA
ncbi:hypothetical protein GCM10009827_067970 [Dactylosporangium maewongense]|uniref:Uncharacterized protein n=1 Tax=Dactylosporangium maewongense TaxID=634393 RepID=A0ABP4M802_9ACTN